MDGLFWRAILMVVNGLFLMRCENWIRMPKYFQGTLPASPFLATCLVSSTRSPHTSSKLLGSNSPHFSIAKLLVGFPLSEPPTSMMRRIFSPVNIYPKTTWYPSSHSVPLKVMKNCEEFEFFPRFDIERMPLLL